MTEIPEHLLKRAQARRAAASGGGDAPAGDTPAAAPAAGGGAGAPAAVEKAPKGPAPLPTLDDDAPPAKPDIAVVAAAKNRKRVPYWGAAVLAILPLWGFLYYFAVKPPPAAANDPIAIGKEIYSANCSGCHMADGSGVKGGGVGQQLNEGHVNATFPEPLDLVHWISFGADEGARANGTYGDPKREGGAMNINTLPGKMPGFGKTLTPEEIAAVTIYIRQEFGGGTAEEDPNFNVATFEADPAKAADTVQQVIDLGVGGDPETGTIDGAETE